MSIIALVVCLGIVALFFVIAGPRKDTTPGPASQEAEHLSGPETQNQATVQNEAPPSPQPQSQTQPQKSFPNDYTLSKPDQVLVAGPSGESLRIFNVRPDASGFVPSEIVVNQGDTLQINLEAGTAPVDINSYELHTYFWAPAGKVQSGSILLPESGLFTLSCKNNCPGGKDASLTLAVLPIK